ncbi:tail fiber protein [Gordonia phage Matteo]|uniref:Uncharacterized protein n=1 Tax=Gordonia phage Matteo TaxID=2759392 RepID=A0A7L7STZ5_9CAUD|nr:tail fiber protein [Gordonia phage Matteo]QOC55975.1 hypothetical protein SEA_MATTEO_45 [Gordonia phage Matteo]
MTAPAINPAAIDAALPDLDAEVACEVPDDHDAMCGAPAVWRVRGHGTPGHRHERYAVQTVLMCDPCVTVLREQLADKLADGAVLCSICGQIFTQVSDVILSVVAL